jgi:TPR repeat protein
LGELTGWLEHQDERAVRDAYENGDAACIYCVGGCHLDIGDEPNLVFAKQHFTAAASLGFAPAFMMLASLAKEDGDEFAAIVYWRIAQEMDHTESIAYCYMASDHFEKRHEGRRLAPALNREVDRIEALVKTTQAQLAAIEDPEQRKAYVKRLINGGGLMAEQPQFCWKPEDEIREPVPHVFYPYRG